MRSLMIAVVLIYGSVCAVGFAVVSRKSEWPASSPSEKFASRPTETLRDNDEAPAAWPAKLDPMMRAEEDSAPEAPQTPAIRFGLLELLPPEQTQFGINKAVSGRATFETAAAAAIEPTIPAENRNWPARKKF